MNFEQLTYNVSEEIDGKSLGLLVCVESIDVPFQFELQLSIEGVTATGNAIIIVLS